ncbi:MAG: L-histidine N(alpha)-methyltransferase [Vicinamibacterales bacterium]
MTFKSTNLQTRSRRLEAGSRKLEAEFARDVARDLRLSPKQLQSKYLYDALGSSLFDAICRLPWYRITRAEQRLLELHRHDIVDRAAFVGRTATTPTIVELGCGSGEKIVLLAEALQARGASARVHLIDISSQALEQTEQRLTRLQHFSVVGHQSTYEEGLRRAAAARDPGSPVLVLFLGSNIGNFDTPAAGAFVQRLRSVLEPGDLMLLGADLVKPERELILAYDDPLGVTAAFNKNLLVRINRELDGRFDLSAFAHRAHWNRDEDRVEMHLVSTRRQTVPISGARVEIAFDRDEWIWTESSYKYSAPQVVLMGADAGFTLVEQWIDEEAQFALTLFVAE